jgi:hypothetical protein
VRTVRNTIFTLALLMIASCCEKVHLLQIPDSVQTSFGSRYPGVVDVKWESADDNGFIAVFSTGQHLTRAHFESTGTWNKTETELKPSEIPLVIMETIKNAFGGSKIFKSVKVESNSGELTYILSLKRRNKIKEVEFSSIGVILREK